MAVSADTNTGWVDLAWRVVGPVIGALVGLFGGYLLWQRRAIRREKAAEKSAAFSALASPMRVNLHALEGAHRLSVRKPYRAGLTCVSAGTWANAQEHFVEALRHASGTQRSALRILIGVCCYKRDVHVQAFQQFMTALTDAEACPDAECHESAQANLDVAAREFSMAGDLEFLYSEKTEVQRGGGTQGDARGRQRVPGQRKAKGP